MVQDLTFQCPLPSGFHARPASQLAEVASRFAADVALVNERTGIAANAKSVLDIVGLDIKLSDTCRLRTSGLSAEAARAALSEFITRVLPGSDEPLSSPAGEPAVVVPRCLRN